MTRKIILMMSVSLDGFFETADRDISWHQVDDEILHHLNAQFRSMGAFMFGRVTHELMAGYWPTADQDPDISAELVEFAGIWREMPKFVFSRTLTQAGWNTAVIHDVVPEEIAELRAQPGGDIALSGANLASTFVHGLIDEFQILVHPVVLGQGRPLFESPDVRMDLRLEGTRSFGNGVVLLHYSSGGAISAKQ
jgi:dihydrofolate reductase